ncbi:serine protease [Tenuifilaceae bacterium CYCD]|nr:serine protease [Tenuifilaceae bacterium CYCD]
MRHIGIIGALLVISTLNITTQAQDKYFVKFKDKNNSPYSIENPSEFLSQRSIERRTKQGISITTNDLPVNPDYLQQIKNTGASVNFQLKWFNGATITITNSNQLTAIQRLSFVESTEKIYQSGAKGYELEVDVQDTKPFNRKRQTPDELNYGNSSTQIKMMNGHILHNNGFMGDGIQIAVLDAGFLNVDTHPVFDSLRTKGRILGTKDFVNSNSNIYEEHYHGMMVLSTMGGYLDGQLIGTAPHAKYWLIRTENADVEQIYEEYCWAAGAEFADSVGADIINTSLGYTTFDITAQSHNFNDLNGTSTPITKATNYASSTGMVVVVSAGNDGDSSWYYISAPADSPNVLTVGAVDNAREKASFSSFGPTYDGRIKPDVCAMGQSAVVANTTGVIGTANGTSFSSPIMAGMVACLWECKPNLKASEIIQLVKTSGSQFQSPNNSIGYGIPDFAVATKIGENIKSKNLLGIFPNPFNNSINIVLPEDTPQYVECTVYSISGSEILTEIKYVTENTFELNIPQHLSKGNYLIKAKTESNTYIGKCVKI